MQCYLLYRKLKGDRLINAQPKLPIWLSCSGASLFWNAPLEKNRESAKQDEVEISNEDINISMNTEKNTSQTSIASSLKAVDIPSFVDSIHVVEGGPDQLCASNW